MPKQKPKVDSSKLTAAGKHQIDHIAEYYDKHKVRNSKWSGEDVAKAVVVQEKGNKDIWKKKS
jgi:hypothetical protein